MKWKYLIILSAALLLIGFVIFGVVNQNWGTALVLLSFVAAPLLKICGWFISLLLKHGKEGVSQENVWNKICTPDERIEYSFGVGEGFIKWMRILWGFNIIGLTLAFIFTYPVYGAVIFLLLIFLLWFSTWYMRIANRYTLTNKRVLIHKGWFSTKLSSIDYGKITDVHVVEPFLAKVLFKTGHLIINTAGTDALEVVLKHVERPYEIKKKLDSLKDKK